MEETEKNSENVYEVFPKREGKSVEATLSYHLFAECPYCEHDNDLADHPHDEEGYFSTPIFNSKWDEIEGHEVTCDNCEQMFTISVVRY